MKSYETHFDDIDNGGSVICGLGSGPDLEN